MAKVKKKYHHPALAAALLLAGACKREAAAVMRYAAQHPTIARAAAASRRAVWHGWAVVHLATAGDRILAGYHARFAALRSDFYASLHSRGAMTPSERALEYMRNDRRAVLRWARRLDAAVARRAEKTRAARRMAA